MPASIKKSKQWQHSHVPTCQRYPQIYIRRRSIHTSDKGQHIIKSITSYRLERRNPIDFTQNTFNPCPVSKRGKNLQVPSEEGEEEEEGWQNMKRVCGRCYPIAE